MILQKTEKIVFFLILLFILPALLINLGIAPLIEDESIRALVALEMDISKDFLTPTLGGMLYFNKPPLFNWIILLFYNLTHSYSEFVIRIPTILFLLVFMYTIYRFTLKHLGNKYALINAFAFLTCGRIIFYDSMLGLIDITYSWLTYLMFNIIFVYYKEGKFNKLFILTYIITAAGFLFKGFPSVIFTGITLLLVFVYHRNFKKLFSVYHFTGIFIFLGIIGLYYYLYYRSNPGALETMFSTLFKESSKRTIVEHNVFESVKHFFLFPFDLLYHFLPWTVLVFLLFKKGMIRKIWNHEYLKYCSLVFLANIVVYWFSPNVYPRYFFMLIPLAFTILIYTYKEAQSDAKNIHIKILDIVFVIPMVFVVGLQFAIPFDERTKEIPFSVLTGIVSLLCYGIIIYFYFLRKNLRLLLTVLFILVFRAQFNCIILKIRENESRDVLCRSDAANIGKTLINEPLLLQNDVEIEGFIYPKLINYQTMFYITRERGEILGRGKAVPGDTNYITFDPLLKGKTYDLVSNLRVHHGNMTARVVKFVDEK